jgi:hypothetical protein
MTFPSNGYRFIPVPLREPDQSRFVLFRRQTGFRNHFSRVC